MARNTVPVGQIEGSKPAFKLGDSAGPAKNRAAKPATQPTAVAAGFETFLNAPDAGPSHTFRRITHQPPEPRESGKKVLELHLPEARISSKKIVPEPDVVDAKPRGMRHFEEKFSQADVGPCFDKKRRVLDSATGARKVDGYSGYWETHTMYGRLKRFGGEQANGFAHGIFPNNHNYPPSHTAQGQPIDYSLVQYGGVFSGKVLRTETMTVDPKPELATRGEVKNGATYRHRKAVELNNIQAGRTSYAELATSKLSRTTTAPAPASFNASTTASRTLTASRSTAAAAAPAPPKPSTSAGPDWRDAKIAALQAQLTQLQGTRQ